MALLEINKDTCTKCGLCAADCPGGLFEFKKNEYPRPVTGIEKYCVGCGHCVAICPTESVIHRECPVDKCLPINKAQKVTFEQVTQLIKGRRSIRVYQDKPVPREIITKLIDTARYAPTGGNSQGVQWLVFDDKADLKRFSEIGTEWMRAASKSNSMMASYLENVIKLQEAGKDSFLRSAPALILALGEKSNPGAVNSCTITLSYFDLAAHSLGLGCCWAGFFMGAVSFPPMAQAIALPEGYKICCAMTLGYPRYNYARIPVRKQARIIWRP